MSGAFIRHPVVASAGDIIWEGLLINGAIGLNFEIIDMPPGTVIELVGGMDGTVYDMPLYWDLVSDGNTPLTISPVKQKGYYYVEAKGAKFIKVYVSTMASNGLVVTRTEFAYEKNAPVNSGSGSSSPPPPPVDLPSLHRVPWAGIQVRVAGGMSVEDAVVAYLKSAGAKLVGNDIAVVTGASGADAGSNGSYILRPKPTDATNFDGFKIGQFDTSMHLVKDRAADTQPVATSVPVGFQVFTTEKNKHEIQVADATGSWVSLFSDTNINERIAMGSLFQGAVKTATELNNLPAPASTNKGFYWTWQGANNYDPAAAGVTGSVVDPTKGIPGETLQPGDWLQSDGTKWLHISSDLLSKARWEGLGSFQPFTAGSWEKGSLVVYRASPTDPLKYWRATIATRPTDPVPGVRGGPWEDITPQMTFAGLLDVDVRTVPLADGDVVRWDANNNRFVNKVLNPIDEYDSTVNYVKGDIVITNGGLWRARQGGSLPEPVRKDTNAYLTIKATGYNSEEIFQVTSINAAAPDATTDVSSSVGHKFHLEWHDDSNWKVYAYDKVAKTWHELAGMAHTVWRSYGEPPDPDRNNSIMLWIKGSKASKAPPSVPAPEWEHFRVATSLAALDDVRLVSENPGQTLVLDKTGKWVAGSPAAHIPEWMAGRVDYNIGNVTHYEGRLWRANTTGNNLAKPEMVSGACVYIYDDAGKTSVLVIKQVGAVAPTTVPTSLAESYLRYVSDTDWEVFKSHVNTTTHAFEWVAVPVPTSKTLWRHVALPPGGSGSYGILWIYAMPHSSTAPIAGQTDWSPILLGDFLVSLADVSAPNAQAGDTLVSDGAGKWIAQKSGGGVQLFADAAHFPATKKAGEVYFDQATKQISVVETDGATTTTDLKVLDQHTLRGDITLGANAATEQEIILVKGIPASNESIYVDLAQSYTGGERCNFALHLFANAASGLAPMIPIHISGGASNFIYFRFFWKDNTDGYCLAARVAAGNNGVVFHTALRFPNALDSGVVFDGNTINTNTAGTKVDALYPYPAGGSISLPSFRRVNLSGERRAGSTYLQREGIGVNERVELEIGITSAVGVRYGIAFEDGAENQLTIGGAGEQVSGLVFGTWAAAGSSSEEEAKPVTEDSPWGAHTYKSMRCMPHMSNNTDVLKPGTLGVIRMTIDNTLGDKSFITVDTFAKRTSGDLNLANHFELVAENKVRRYTLIDLSAFSSSTEITTTKGWIKTTTVT